VSCQWDPPVEAWPDPLLRWTRGVAAGRGAVAPVFGAAVARLEPEVPLDPELPSEPLVPELPSEPLVPELPSEPLEPNVVEPPDVSAALAVPDQLAAASSPKPAVPASPATTAPVVSARRRSIAWRRRRTWGRGSWFIAPVSAILSFGRVTWPTGSAEDFVTNDGRGRLRPGRGSS
jgi:hypothetical protein